METPLKQALTLTPAYRGITPRFGVNETIDPVKVRFDARRAATGPEFTTFCAIHGRAIFDTATGACMLCISEKSDLPPRVAYLTSYGDKYPRPCPLHGADALAHGKSDKCAQCFDARGRPLTNPSPRAVARRAGLKSYVAPCPVHGDASPHDVRTGRCRACWTSPPSPRAVARRAGLKSYVAPCPVHGEAHHSVAHGKCLQCFTTAGVKRTGTVRGNPDRVAARRAGRSTYRGLCGIHGRADFNTARGQCLKCFTVAGSPRVRSA